MGRLACYIVICSCSCCTHPKHINKPTYVFEYHHELSYTFCYKHCLLTDHLLRKRRKATMALGSVGQKPSGETFSTLGFFELLVRVISATHRTAKPSNRNFHLVKKYYVTDFTMTRYKYRIIKNNIHEVTTNHNTIPRLSHHTSCTLRYLKVAKQSIRLDARYQVSFLE